MSKILVKNKSEYILASLLIFIFIISIIQFTLFLNNNRNDSNNISVKPNNIPIIAKNKLQSSFDSPITIDGNNNFTTTASINHWVGNGSSTNPFIIENLNLTFQPYNSWGFLIKNTNLHFIIQNNYLSLSSNTGNSSYLLFLWNASNGLVKSNTLYVNTGYIDLYVLQSVNDTIKNNFVKAGDFGIFVDSSTNTLITQNTVEDTSAMALSLGGTSYHLIANNNTLNSNVIGISATYLENVSIANNSITNSKGPFLYIIGVANGTINNNNLVKGNSGCMYLQASNFTHINLNCLNDCGGSADLQLINSNNNSIIGNTFNNSLIYGLLFQLSNFNTIMYNYFTNSNPVNMSSMPSNNIFKNNYIINLPNNSSGSDYSSLTSPIIRTTPSFEIFAILSVLIIAFLKRRSSNKKIKIS